MCEFTPREIILAAGAVPVCLCGGSAATIPAAEQFLPANLCPLIKSTFGYHVTGKNPFLNWADLVVAETTCDGKKKMFELMSATKPMYVLELPQKADDADALEHWTREVRKFKEHLEQRFQTPITDEKLRDAARLMNRERGLRRQLADLMTRDPPPLTGRQLIEFKSIISGIEADLQQYERALEIFGGARSNIRAGEPAAQTRNPCSADRRADCPRRGARAGIDRRRRRGGGRDGELHRPQTDSRRCGSGRAGPASRHRPEILPPALFGYDAEHPAFRNASLARGEIPSALRHRTGLAGVPHLRH